MLEPVNDDVTYLASSSMGSITSPLRASACSSCAGSMGTPSISSSSGMAGSSSRTLAGVISMLTVNRCDSMESTVSSGDEGTSCQEKKGRCMCRGCTTAMAVSREVWNVTRRESGAYSASVMPSSLHTPAAASQCATRMGGPGASAGFSSASLASSTPSSPSGADGMMTCFGIVKRILRACAAAAAPTWSFIGCGSRVTVFVSAVTCCSVHVRTCFEPGGRRSISTYITPPSGTSRDVPTLVPASGSAGTSASPSPPSPPSPSPLASLAAFAFDSSEPFDSSLLSAAPFPPLPPLPPFADVASTSASAPIDRKYASSAATDSARSFAWSNSCQMVRMATFCVAIGFGTSTCRPTSVNGNDFMRSARPPLLTQIA
mmetsp:Transcript_16581/g.57984  ORF Transcript_16581/g.57984 Transcript_16581/m.57984 type:complete len:374 (-) Transcript_16581:690-1811(-)